MFVCLINVNVCMRKDKCNKNSISNRNTGFLTETIIV